MDNISEYFLSDEIGQEDFWKVSKWTQNLIMDMADDAYLERFFEHCVAKGIILSDKENWSEFLFKFDTVYDGTSAKTYAQMFSRLFKSDSEACRLEASYLLDEHRAYTLAWMVALGAIPPTESAMGEIVALAEEDLAEQSATESHSAIGRAIRIFDRAGLLDRSDITDEAREYYLGS